MKHVQTTVYIERQFTTMSVFRINSYPISRDESGFDMGRLVSF